MRELTISECDSVAGGYYDSTGYDDTRGNGGGNPPDPGSSSPADPTVGPMKAWQDVLGNIDQFLNEATNVVSAGADQNSYYEDGSNYAPMDTWFTEQFGWLPAVQRDPSTHYFDFLTNDVDPEFLLESESGNHFSAQYAGGEMTVNAIDGNHIVFSTNGITAYGEFHPGAPTTDDAGTLTVNGGYYSFTYTASGYDPSNPNPPPPVAPAPGASKDSTVNVNNTEQHRQSLDTQLHSILNSNGGHYSVAFNGPSGTETIDLAEFVGILDKYHLQIDDNTNYATKTGGAGQVIKNADGTYETDIRSVDLAGYAANPNGLDFLVAHEVSHELGQALAYTRQLHTAYLNDPNGHHTEIQYTGTTGTNGSAALYKSESYVNNIATSVLSLLGIPAMQNPGGGTTYSGTYLGK